MKGKGRYPHIGVDPAVCTGQPRIEGTRITVGLIAREVEYLCMTADEVIAAHPHLTLAQVHAALAYFYDLRTEMEAAMREAESFEAELRARFPERVQELLALRRG
jgi:uncharacterized protein (DUF433 family)